MYIKRKSNNNKHLIKSMYSVRETGQKSFRVITNGDQLVVALDTGPMMCTISSPIPLNGDRVTASASHANAHTHRGPHGGGLTRDPMHNMTALTASTGLRPSNMDTISSWGSIKSNHPQLPSKSPVSPLLGSVKGEVHQINVKVKHAYNNRVTSFRWNNGFHWYPHFPRMNSTK